MSVENDRREYERRRARYARAERNGDGPEPNGAQAASGREGSFGELLERGRLLELGREPMPWVVDRFAARGYLTVLAGRGGEGKSLVTLAIAAAVQSDAGEVGGLRVAAASGAIWDAESGPPLLGRRLALLDPHEAAPALYDAVPDLGASVRLTRAEDLDAIAGEIERRGYELVVLDALRTLAPDVKESDGDEMAPLIVATKQLARRTKAAVVLSTHRDKALEHDYRGSSTLHDQADLVFVLERDKKDPQRRWRRRLRCSKARICEEPEDRWIGLKTHGGTLTITEAEPPAHEGKRTKADDLADEALETLKAADGRLTGAEVARRLERPKSDGTVRKALDKLAEQGRAARDDSAGGWGCDL